MIDRNTRCVVVGGLAENLGGMVRVVGLSRQGNRFERICGMRGPWWDCECLTRITVERASDGRQTRVQAGTVVPFPSSILRQLGDGAGADESLAWQSVPKSSIAPPPHLAPIQASLSVLQRTNVRQPT